MLLLNKLKLVLVLFSFPLFVNGCGDRNQEPSSTKEDYLNDNQKLLQHLQENFDPEIKAALYSQFDSDSTKKEILAIKETTPSKTDKWGLKIQRLSKDSLIMKDEFFLPEMSTNESICITQKIDSISYDLFYYNSGSFYIGSSGGEVFAYLIDFAENSINRSEEDISNVLTKSYNFLKDCSKSPACIGDYSINLNIPEDFAKTLFSN